MGWWGAIFVGVVLTLLIERVLVDRWLSPRFSKFWSRRRDRRYERDNEFMRDVVRAYVDPAVAVAIVGQSLGRVIWGLGFGGFLVILAVLSEAHLIPRDALEAMNLFAGLVGFWALWGAFRAFNHLGAFCNHLIKTSKVKHPLEDMELGGRIEGATAPDSTP